MDTSEALDLSKENIQPLKQGRNAVKLGTALQAQNNAELYQQLMAEREEFELLIRMYEGDDPLQPNYDYVRWIEQSFPKHGPESNLVQILENTLSAFKDDPRYKQDIRYAELLIKYIDTQANPLEIYQIVYDQGLCTMCASFYKAWAEEYDKINDIKSADKIFELGIKVKALPLELLPEAQLRFHLSLGRRMLGYQESEVESEHSRQALHKLQKKNMFGERDPVGVPGRVKQQVLGSNNTKGNANVPFKVYQADDNGCEGYGDSQGKTFPKQGLVNKENTLKAGPWNQQGGKHRSRGPVPSNHGPAFQVHEDEDADLGNVHPRTPAVPRALKPRKVDNFTCPLAVFEPPDPTKQPMYCKNKVYAGGTEFQFEELRAALYNRRHEKLLAARREQEEEEMRQKAENEATYVKAAPDVICIENLRAAEEVEYKTHDPPSIVEVQQDSMKNNLLTPEFINNGSQHINSEEVKEEEVKNEAHFEEPVEQVGFEHKNLPLEGNTSVFHCQSFTVNTKEAMNVVQEMWQSPTPSQVSLKNMRASRGCPVSPANLDESGVFKIPTKPAPHIPLCTSAKKSIVPFPVFSDDEPSPAPTPTLVKSFEIYSDEGENQIPKNEVNPTETENAVPHRGLALPFSLEQMSPGTCKGTDAATMKMLAFQSDSEEECDILPKPNEDRSQKPNTEVPVMIVTSATPVERKKSIGPGFIVNPPIYDEDKFEDMTCNTKAFDFALPSSTPLVGHFQSKADQNAKSNINGSYIVEDVRKSTALTRQDLSVVFEASKERYSSSSGSSGSKTQGSVCTVGSTSCVPANQPPELIEKLAQISANKTADELDKSLELMKISGPIDPFSTELITQLLSHIEYPKKHHLIGLVRQDCDCPALHTNSTVTLGNTKYSVVGELGKGAYARVLKATRNGQPVALKQQRPAWEWEWYIVQELQSRLPPNMMSGYLHMSTGYIYRNASILESEWAQYGSILSVVNKMKIAGKGQDLHLALLLSIQLVSIIEHLHKCRIIHGDVKPDNFVLFSLPTVDVSEPCLKLIDFGRSIDMTLFPDNTTFTTVVTTDGFQCNEMKEGRPWTYQTDLYGLAGSIYCVLFYDYMKVVKKDKRWQLSSKVPRYMKPAMWTEVFAVLLNVESCDSQPNLTALRETLEQNFKEMDPTSVQISINKLTNMLLNK